MRIENFKRFDVRSYHCDDTALLFAFEFCGTKDAQCAEDFIAENRQKSERDIVIAVLLEISKQPAKHAATYRKTDNPPVRKRNRFSERFRHTYRAEYRYSHSADETHASVYNG